METDSRPLYTTRIIKASALIADTKLLLAEWRLADTVEANLERVRRENLLGKSSRTRLTDVLTIFRQRYFDDLEVGEALVTLAQGHAPSPWLDPLLYFFSALNDRTLRDLVIEVLYRRSASGYTEVSPELILRQLRTWVAEGQTTTAWEETTMSRVARGVMATLRDFGVLEGKVNKRLTPIYLPTPAFALIALWLQKREQAGNRVLHSEDWRLFFLPVEGVERFFLEAHQEHLLSYYAAGSVVRLEFPAATMREYAHVLLERAS